MTDAELKAELALPAYAGMTATQKAAPFRVAAMNEPNKTAWLQVLASIRSLKEGFKPSDTSVAPLLAQGVTDGAITAGEKTTLETLGLRPGSRAEELWGEGTVVSLNDVARAS
jgi:hypothetical protein